MTLQTIGNHIRTIRKSKHITQNDLASKLNLDRTYLSRAEAGKQNLTIETLIRICEEGLEISLKEFFGGIVEE